MPNTTSIFPRAGEAAPLLSNQSAEPYCGYVTPNLLETRDFNDGGAGSLEHPGQVFNIPGERDFAGAGTEEEPRAPRRPSASLVEQ